MALTKSTKNMNIVSQLNVEPNDIGGMSAVELQATFDEGGLSLQNYINNTLIPELEASGVLEILRTKSGEMKYIRINGDGAIEISADNVTWVATASSGHVILDKNNAALPQRSRLKFTNSTVTDDGTVTIVEGIKGDKGDKGEKGDKGDQGVQGIKGDVGSAWYPSLDGLGTLTFTLSPTTTPPPSYNIRGPQGPQGAQGQQGVAGATGQQGVQGTRGPQGIQGEKGDQGAKGNTGTQGIQGPIGPQGIQGIHGADGRSFVIQDVYATLGALKTAFPNGNEDAYQVSYDKNIYIWSEIDTDWVSLGQLQGPQGPQGIQGVQGPQGEIGPKGDKGDKGDQGIQGIQGVDGIQGLQGIQGIPGNDGKSAYSSAVSGGYVGTETGFNTALADIPNKATKKVPAAVGNLAALDASGNLTDSGKKTTDFATTAQGTKADNAIPTSQKGVANGVASLDGTGKVRSGQLPQVAPALHKTSHSVGGADALIDSDIGLTPAVATALGLDPLDNPQVKDGFNALSKSAIYEGSALTSIDGNQISGVRYTIRSYSDVNKVASVSLDTTNISWGDYEDIYVEFDASASSIADCNIRIDNGSTLGQYKNGPTNTGSLVSFTLRPDSSRASKFRCYLKILDLRASLGYVHVAAMNGIHFSSDSDGTTTAPDPLVVTTRTNGGWCILNTINLVVSTGTMTVKNIKIRGTKR